jgi:hypothetical protein
MIQKPRKLTTSTGRGSQIMWQTTTPKLLLWEDVSPQDPLLCSLLTSLALLERHAILQSPSKIEELVKIFIHGTKVSFFFPCLPISVDVLFEDGDWLLGYGSWTSRGLIAHAVNNQSYLQIFVTTSFSEMIVLEYIS